jgi:dipeptidyl aminopeptidase/acylaminoacyl peptidase
MERYQRPLLTLWVLLACLALVNAQTNQKKDLLPADYGQWHQLQIRTVSEKGNWICYTHHYTHNADTLFARNTRTLKTYAFPKGTSGAFMGETHFVCLQHGNRLGFLDLGRDSRHIIDSITAYGIAGSDYLLLERIGRYSKRLLIRNVRTNTDTEVPNVVQWKLDPTQSRIACITEVDNRFAVRLIELGRLPEMTVLLENRGAMRQLEWNSTGIVLGFLSAPDSQHASSDRGAVYCYSTIDRKLWALDLSACPAIVEASLAMGASYNSPLLVTEDGQRVFFGLESTSQQPLEDPSAVQVWNTQDQSIHPAKISVHDWRKRPVIAVWLPATGQAFPVTSYSRPFLQLDANGRYAVVSNPLEYEPQFKYHGDRDYYLIDLETGSSRLFLERASGEPTDLVASPGGRYLLYYKARQWWSYDLDTGTQACLTHNIEWDQENEDSSADALTSRVAGFSADDDQVLIYDAYDVWKIRADGSTSERITDGRATRTRFTIAPASLVKPRTYLYDGYQAAAVDLGHSLYFRSVNTITQQTGIYVYTGKGHAKPVLTKDKLLTSLILTADRKKAFFLEEDFNEPPKVVLLDFKTRKEKNIWHSNPQHSGYYYGKSELFSFDLAGATVGGVLLYPARYDPNKKYPMIVHIYQKQTTELHQYQNPSLANRRGFNPTHYTLQGYFVCLPNMAYEIGDTGTVASRCVNAAVQHILERNIIEKDRIGLIGHSYGGYETNFIVTQQNPFRTAVSGASYSDLAADFLHVAWDFKSADYRRYEHGQMRMGKTLFEDPERYHRNSPILHAEGVSIPLLLWTGANDHHVDAAHSYKFHMALRRLGKENVMLVYPGEKHVLQNPKNQTDLNIRINEWFDYHLKDGSQKPWMMPNFREE